MPYIRSLENTALLMYDQTDIQCFAQLATNPLAKFSLTQQGTFCLESAPMRKLGLDFSQLGYFKFQGKTFTEWSKEYSHIALPPTPIMFLGLITNQKILQPLVHPGSSVNHYLPFVANQHLEILRRAYLSTAFEIPQETLQKIALPLNCNLKQTTMSDGVTPDKSIDLYYDFSTKPEQWTLVINNKISISDSGAQIPFEYRVIATLPIDIEAKNAVTKGFEPILITVNTNSAYALAFNCFLHINRDWDDVPKDLHHLLLPLIRCVATSKTSDGLNPQQLEAATKLKQLLTEDNPTKLTPTEIEELCVAFKQPGKLHDAVWDLGFLIAVKYPALYQQLGIATEYLRSDRPPSVDMGTPAIPSLSTTTKSKTKSGLPTTSISSSSSSAALHTMSSSSAPPQRSIETQTIVASCDAATQTEPKSGFPKSPHWTAFKRQLRLHPITTIPAPDQSKPGSLPSLPTTPYIKQEEINSRQLSQIIDQATHSTSSSATNNNLLMQDFLTGLIFQNRIVDPNTLFNLGHATVLNDPYILDQVKLVLQNIIETDVLPLIPSRSSSSSSSSSIMPPNTGTPSSSWSDLLETEEQTSEAQTQIARHIQALMQAYHTRAISIPFTIFTEVIKCFSVSNTVKITPEHKKHLYYCQIKQCWVLETEQVLRFYVTDLSHMHYCFQAPLIIRTTQILRVQHQQDVFAASVSPNNFTLTQFTLIGHASYITLFKNHIAWDKSRVPKFVSHATAKLKQLSDYLMEKAAAPSSVNKSKDPFGTSELKLSAVTKLYFLLIDNAHNDFVEGEILALLDDDVRETVKDLTFLIGINSKLLYERLTELHQNPLVPTSPRFFS